MSWAGNQNRLTHLGTLRGTGELTTVTGKRSLGDIHYEIDGYVRLGKASANGRLEGTPDQLTEAFRGGLARLDVAGVPVDVVLSNPSGSDVAEVEVHGHMPVFRRGNDVN